MGDITGATVIFTLVVPPIFPVPQVIQGFATDDVASHDEIESVETLMGVDGVLSAGWTWKPQQQIIMLQADSPSNDFFDVWYQQMKSGQTTYAAQGILQIPAIDKKLIATNGYLTRYKLPDIKRMLQPRRFGITWNEVVPAPA